MSDDVQPGQTFEVLETSKVSRPRRKPYSAYKPSGVARLDDVPAHWEVTRFKYTVDGCQNGLWGDEPTGNEDDIICIRVADFDRTRSRVNDAGFTMRSILISQRHGRELQPGDLLLEKSGGGELQPVGKVVLYDLTYPAVSSNFVARMRPLKNYDAGFLTYLHDAAYAGRLNVFSIKQNTGIQNLDSSSYLHEQAAFPPIAEQRAIAVYLDHETARLDALIAKKKRLIELLQERRTALISHAVTRGVPAKTFEVSQTSKVSTTVSYKPSGVAWLGEIPEHWDVLPNFQLFRQRDERNCPELPLLQVGIGMGVAIREFSNEHIEQKAADPATYKVARAGDIAFNKMRMWQGAVGVAPVDGLVSPDYVVAKPNANANPKYFAELFRTSVYKTEVNRYSHGIVDDRNRLYWDDFKQIKSIVPPRSEQDVIVDFLDRETAKIDALIAKVRQAIETLREYRAALISAAVTGKMDVRETPG